VFDADNYRHDRERLTEAIYNTSLVESMFFASNWSAKFGRNDGTLYNNGDEPWYGGPLSATAAGPKYNMDPHKLYNSTSLLSDVTNLLQQFLGETLMEAWKQDFNRDQSTLFAGITTSRLRIVTSHGVGATLGALLLLSNLSMLHVYYTTRLVRRPLGLDQDPGKIEAAASLLLGDPFLRDKLDHIDTLSRDELSLRLEGYVLGMIGGKLRILRHEENDPSDEGWCILAYARSSL